ncbi:PREDICTED: probable aquaporin SIP2-1 [Tarenaya hassleriana]|uniref:probable aquaporin SIP2-1 n=1 Tax=Tarenaya hassleriana TaxID=28532 RepID=UPI00053C9C6D|nr:PREDICTED: probable aquaporin SIP2-1 [Tarenaya hassleriana]XP_010541345.1 PREDICTED: probable aquaporin SIP2-1 [Tarenaya hassleriana]
MGKISLVVADFVLAFMWVWAGVLANLLVHGVWGYGRDTTGDLVRYVLSVANMFLFAYFQKLTNGGLYNPLTTLAAAVSSGGGVFEFIFAVAIRIPVEVAGSILGVRHVLQTFPEIGRGPRLNVAIHHGALTEGMLTFAIVTISLGVSRKIPGSFFMKTWIGSLSKLTLHVLGSDLTGGCMNPAAVMGWAYARGEHITKEHILVYWLAPVEATLMAVWIFRLVVRPLATAAKAKSE